MISYCKVSHCLAAVIFTNYHLLDYLTIQFLFNNNVFPNRSYMTDHLVVIDLTLHLLFYFILHDMSSRCHRSYLLSFILGRRSHMILSPQCHRSHRLSLLLGRRYHQIYHCVVIDRTFHHSFLVADST